MILTPKKRRGSGIRTGLEKRPTSVSGKFVRKVFFILSSKQINTEARFGCTVLDGLLDVQPVAHVQLTFSLVQLLRVSPKRHRPVW